MRFWRTKVKPRRRLRKTPTDAFFSVSSDASMPTDLNQTPTACGKSISVIAFFAAFHWAASGPASVAWQWSSHLGQSATGTSQTKQ